MDKKSKLNITQSDQSTPSVRSSFSHREQRFLVTGDERTRRKPQTLDKDCERCRLPRTDGVTGIEKVSLWTSRL